METTFDERALYSRPWTITTQGTLVADTDLLEYVCETHTKGARLIGRASDGIDPRSVAKIPDAMLARYAGTYEYHLPENATALRTMLVTVRDGQLLIDGNRALIPQSETRFVLRGARQIEFLTDANGEVEGIRVQRTGWMRRILRLRGQPCVRRDGGRTTSDASAPCEVRTYRGQPGPQSCSRAVGPRNRLFGGDKRGRKP